MTTGYLKIALKNTHTQGTQKSGTAKENMDWSVNPEQAILSISWIAEERRILGTAHLGFSPELII
jgi:hypothetical protein